MSDAPTPEEERAAADLTEQLAKLRVEDAIMSTLMTVSAIGFRHLAAPAEGEEKPDFEQARLAIETMRALAPLLEPRIPTELLRDMHGAIANLQLAYAQAVSRETAAGEAGDSPAS